MKNIYNIIIVLTAGFYLASCSISPTDKAQSAVKSYLKENLKKGEGYKSISFSLLDTLEEADTTDLKISLYKITHIYSIINSDKDKAKMTVSFYLDKDFNVNKPNTNSINGDYGKLTGNTYWEYNEYVGNKADSGSEITLYSLDTIRGNLKFNVITDLQGNYMIDKIFPGEYFLIVRSANTTDCPENHFDNFSSFKLEFKKLFNFDIEKYEPQLNAARIDMIEEKWAGSNFQLEKYLFTKREYRTKAEKLFESFPYDFKSKIKLFTIYGNAYKFSTIRIEENKTNNQISDFGNTCI